MDFYGFLLIFIG